MLLFYLMVAVAVSNDFCVRACKLITIGEESRIPANAIACTTAWHTSPPNPSIHPGYRVSNNGETPFQASIYYKISNPLQSVDVFCEAGSLCSPNSTTNVWHPVADPVSVEPLETVIISPPAEVFYYTRVVVISKHSEDNSKVEAVVKIEYNDVALSSKSRRNDRRGSSMQTPKSVEHLKTVLKFAGSKLPRYIKSSGIEALVELFWPANEMNMFEELGNKTRYLTERGTLPETAYKQVMGLKDTILNITSLMREGKRKGTFDEFKNGADKLPYAMAALFLLNGQDYTRDLGLIDLYAAVISIKVLYYSYGLKCSEKMNLPAYYVDDLKRRLNNMIYESEYGAKNVILKLLKDAQDRQKPGSREFDRIMMTRNELKKIGYVPMWINMLNNPGQEFVDDGIVYEELIGDETEKTVQMAEAQPSEPLTPTLLPGAGRVYNTLAKLETYHGPCADASRHDFCIHGVKLTYKDNSTHVKGIMNKYPFSNTILFRDPIKSVDVRPQSPGYSYIRVGMEPNRQNQTYYFYLGLLEIEASKNEPNRTLEAPTGYKVASMYWEFHATAFRNLALSYVPISAESPSKTETQFKDWNC